MSLSRANSSPSPAVAATAAVATPSDAPAQGRALTFAETDQERKKENKSKAARSSSRLSLFSFARLGFRSRTRYVEDFHIQPAEPHRKYAAGDRVLGHVVLTIAHPIRITHLTVALHGFVRVSRGPNIANEPPFNPTTASATGSSEKSRYFGNGLASLFQDEQVLSGDGKLELGRYQFGFDLLFPEKGLPSSIDFERGTISYMITATLTRPEGAIPTQSCERKLQLVERVDIGSIPAPRPRTIYLEPLSKKKKRRKHAAVEKGPITSEAPEAALSEADSTVHAPNSNEGSVIADDASQEVHYTPRSPITSEAQSEISGDSNVTTSTGRSGRGPEPHPATSSQGSHIGGTTGSIGQTLTVDDKTITATIESLKGGCLPGEIVPVRISIQHIKRIKSMHGVIVTLYRQGRIDSAPSVKLFTDLSKEEIRRLEKKEEYYPKSRTGLGGLSLSAAGSCSVFRKDLSQSFSPLIINPATLNASVTASVRIPEDAFPSIRGVPGDMISFKYNLEVLVDLGGKLAGQLQSGQTPGGSGGVGSSVTRNPYDSGSGFMAAQTSGSILDTTPLRRQKGVIALGFEVTVGTVNSNRQRPRRMSRNTSSAYPDEAPPVNVAEAKDPYQNGREVEDEGYDRDAEGPYPYPEEYPFPAQEQAYHHLHPPSHYHSQHSTPSGAPFYVPPPVIEEDSNLTEKDRIRRAEQRLLPSAPVAGPSAPAIEEEDIYDADVPAPAGASHLEPPHQHLPAADHAPSAPTLDDLTPASIPRTTEDKQELERRRLLAEASAPPEFPEDYDAGVGSSSASAPSAPPAPSAPATAPAGNFEPSAPVLGDEDDYGAHYAYGPVEERSSTHTPSTVTEQLPKYER